MKCRCGSKITDEDEIAEVFDQADPKKLGRVSRRLRPGRVGRRMII